MPSNLEWNEGQTELGEHSGRSMTKVKDKTKTILTTSFKWDPVFILSEKESHNSDAK